jgi:TonB family protein
LNFRNGRLNRIIFDAGGIVDDAAQCSAIFDSVIESLEARFGAFTGAAAPNEYGTPLPVRTTAHGSTIRSYRHGPEQGSHANRRIGGWIDAVAHAGPYPGVPRGTLLCEITVDLRPQAPPLFVSLTPPTPAELAAARPMQPVWREQPDSDTFEMAMPQYTSQGRVDVSVDLDCLVIAEERLNCAVAQESPPGRFYGEFALRLSRHFRIEPVVDGEPSLGRRVRVPVTVTLMGPDAEQPESAAVPAAPPSVDLDALRALAAQGPTREALAAAPLLEHAFWIERPNARSFERYFPTDALLRGVSGRVVLDCLIGADGRLRCAVTEEQPADEGFGLAALGIAQDFRMAADVDGVSTTGKRVRVPIRFNLVQ